ncbi:MAG: hypothetical protein ACFFCS_25275 [Candidatus Hodarchaeota archaeon]
MVRCPVCNEEYPGEYIRKDHLKSKNHVSNLKSKGLTKDDPALALLEPDLVPPKPRSPDEFLKSKEDDKASALLKEFKGDMKTVSESPMIIDDDKDKAEDEEDEEYDPHKPKKKKKELAKITVAPRMKKKPAASRSQTPAGDIKMDISLLEPKDPNMGTAGDVDEHYLGGDFTLNKIGRLIFKFKDRNTKILNYQLHLLNITPEELDDIENITVEVKTNLADEKNIFFTRESFSAFDEQRVFTVDEDASSPEEFFSDHESMRISDEYRVRPEISFTIRFLKVKLKNDAKERLVKFKEHAESIFKYRLVTIKLGGYIGRFMENIMSKLVFLTFLMSIFTFLSQNLWDIGRYISIAGVGIIVLIVIIVIILQGVKSKKIRDQLKEKTGVTKQKRTKKIVVDD